MSSTPSQDSNYVRIFDTTLRDGEQSPGATMTSLEKLEVGRALARLGVDIIEAGFPAASPDDLRGVQQLAERVGQQPANGRPQSEPPVICGLARAMERDIDKTWEAVAPAAHPRIHTFIATSPIHREHKLRMSKQEVLARIREMVGYAKSKCADIEFSPEDAGRTELDFLSEAVQVAIDAGATTINIPDTVGYTTPNEFGARIAHLMAHVPNVNQAVLSVHCHNDLGLATANALAGIQAGARQAEVTINGIGERAGNTALEELVMALHTRSPLYGLTTGIDTTQIARTSKLVSATTGMAVQPNKAIVGANAFAHESGIHQDAMLKHEETYEIMRPETVGITQSSLILGKHSGRHALKNRLEELGFGLEGEDLNKIFERFKELADRKKVITNADLMAMVSTEMDETAEGYQLDAVQVASGSAGMPTATLRLRDPEGNLHTAACIGTGLVDACFKAIKEIVPAKAVLMEYTVQSVTQGIDALGEVSVRLRPDTADNGQTTDANEGRLNPQKGLGQQRVFHGHGADTDVIVAGVQAYLNALNRMMLATPHTQENP